MKHPPTTVTFDRASADEVIEAMEDIRRVGTGWINLSVDVDEALMPPPPSPIAHLFRSRSSEIALATWTPPDPNVDGAPQILGLSHRLGAKIVPLLGPMSLTPPNTWRRIQDSPRRGLVVGVPADESTSTILDWLMRLTLATTRIESTGDWIAQIYRR